MADEVLKRDQNHVTVLAGIGNDSDQDILMLRVDPITKRLLVSADLSGSAVTSLNGLTGAITLAQGTGITLGTVGNTITITNTLDLSGYVPYTGATANVNLGANNLTVDTNTFFVDATNNRVGIGTTAPAKTLDVAGTTHIDGAFTNYNSRLGDMGTEVTSDLRGYGSTYITDKTLNNVVIGANGTATNGGLRMSTVGSFEVNKLGTWFPISSNVVLVEDTTTPQLAGFVYEVLPVGYTNYIEIQNGASVFNLGNNGLPITNAWKTSMGANPVPSVVGGRTIS